MRKLLPTLFVLTALAGVVLAQVREAPFEPINVSLEALVAKYAESQGRKVSWHEDARRGNVTVIRPTSKRKPEPASEAVLIRELLRRRKAVIVPDGENWQVVPESVAIPAPVDADALARADDAAWVSTRLEVPEHAQPPKIQTSACMILAVDGGLELVGRAVDVRRWRDVILAREELRAAHTREFKTPAGMSPQQATSLVRRIYPSAYVSRVEDGLIVITAHNAQLDQLQSLIAELSGE